MARGVLGAVALAGAGLLGWLGLRAQPSEVPQARVDERCTRATAGEAETCARCHAAIHAQWRASGHAAAFEGAVFRAEYDPAPSPFCADCHAAARASHGHRAHDGVDCASCHAPAQALRPDLPDGAAPKGSESCARCHQFTFSSEAFGTHGVYDPADPLQDTVHEWQASAAARDGIECIDCHMPWIDEGDARHRDHRLVGAGDPTLVGDSILVEATLGPHPDGLELTLELAPGDVGHRVPTGDMFRRLRVAAWTDGTPPVEHWLGRWFAQMPASDDHDFRLRPVFDDRVPAPGAGEPVQVRLVLPGGPARAGAHQPDVHWSVELYRMPPDQARERGLDPASLRTLVAEGAVIAAQ